MQFVLCAAWAYLQWCSVTGRFATVTRGVQRWRNRKCMETATALPSRFTMCVECQRQFILPVEDRKVHKLSYSHIWSERIGLRVDTGPIPRQRHHRSLTRRRNENKPNAITHF